MTASVLLLRALKLGDYLTGVPAYRAVKAAFPEHRVVLAAPEGLRPLVELTDAIDVLLPTGELEPIPWDGPPPEWAIDLHGNGPASHDLVEATGAEHCLMYDVPSQGPQWDPNEHEVARWCRLLEWAGIPADPSDLRLRAPRRSQHHGAVVIHPGASSGSRRWPVARFATVARELASQGLAVVVTGSAAERTLAKQVAALAGLPDRCVLAGRTSLSDLAVLVSGARLVISGDTGTSHLATAFGTPSVTLFGPVSPALWGPPSSDRHIALWKGGDAGRPGDAHGDQPDPRLLAITTADTLEAANHLLTSSHALTRG